MGYRDFGPSSESMSRFASIIGALIEALDGYGPFQDENNKYLNDMIDDARTECAVINSYAYTIYQSEIKENPNARKDT